VDVQAVTPPPWETVPDMLHDSAVRHADREAVVDGPVRLSFTALRDEAQQVANALAAEGVEPGDRVALWASNGWQWVVTACGIWLRGAVIVPLSSRWKPAEITPLLARTNTRLLFANEEAAGDALLAALASFATEGDGQGPLPALPDLAQVVCFDGVSTGLPAALSWDAFMAAGEGESSEVDVDPTALCQILFTSGTTGAPKGVELRQRQLLQAYWDWSGIGGLEAGDRFLVIPPYSHGFGINAGILACLIRGATNVPMAVFEPRAALEMVVREHITVMGGPPTLFATLMQLPDFASADVSSLRLAFIGAAAVPTEIILRMEERMGIERVCNAYGLIEGCVISMTRAEDSHEVISTTTGPLVPGVEVRIVDSEGNEVETGERGEIWIRGQGVMSGYWRDPEQTAAAVTPEGWLRSGDVGVFDADGNLRIVDRLKDSYNCGGFSAYPAEIESQLLSRPELAQVAVVGVPHERLGEVGHAFVVPATGHEVDVDSLEAWSRENMAGYKVPRSFQVVEALPQNANGKVAKDVLRARIAQAVEELP
jgi:acyl-CoA synthetase (AMP-forming)/AMP-acid ligase II